LKDQISFDPMRSTFQDFNYDLSYFPSFNDEVQFDELFDFFGDENSSLKKATDESTNYDQMKSISVDHDYSKPALTHETIEDVSSNCVNITMPEVVDNRSISLFTSESSSPNSETHSENNYSFDGNHSPLSEAVEFLDLSSFSSAMDYNFEYPLQNDATPEMSSSGCDIIDVTGVSSDDGSNEDDNFHESISSDGGSPKSPTLTLSAEEKQLLTREGITLPTHLPLTKSEERALKTVRRKIRNKISAKESRMRKGLYVEGLEKRVEVCTKQNIELLKKVDSLQKDNQTLKSKFLKLQSYINNGNKPTQPSTCLMVIMLSLALLVAPNLNVFNEENEVENEKQAIMPGRSRNLLQLDHSVSELFDGEVISPENITPVGTNKSKIVYKSIINPEIFKKANENNLNSLSEKMYKKEQPPDMKMDDKVSMVQSWITSNFDENIIDNSQYKFDNISNSRYNLSTSNGVQKREIVLEHNYTQILTK